MEANVRSLSAHTLSDLEKEIIKLRELKERALRVLKNSALEEHHDVLDKSVEVRLCLRKGVTKEEVLALFEVF